MPEVVLPVSGKVLEPEPGSCAGGRERLDRASLHAVDGHAVDAPCALPFGSGLVS